MMKQLSDSDYDLSMRLSPRAKSPRGKVDPESLRSLLIHRLSDTYKAVLRRSLRVDLGSTTSVYCEPCKRWSTANAEGATGTGFTCPSCDRRFRVELIIYEEITAGGDDA